MNTLRVLTSDSDNESGAADDTKGGSSETTSPGAALVAKFEAMSVDSLRTRLEQLNLAATGSRAETS